MNKVIGGQGVVTPFRVFGTLSIRCRVSSVIDNITVLFLCKIKESEIWFSYWSILPTKNLSACAEILSSVLAGIFVGYNKELHDMTTNAICLFALSYIISGINIFASAFFTALNNGLVSAIISFLRTLVFQVAFIFILPLLLDLNGIWLAVVGAEICSLIISVSFFVTNRKKYKYV